MKDNSRVICMRVDKDSKKPRRNHTETSTGSPLVDRRNMQLLDVL